MNDPENIKALIPVVCPFCEKTSVVEFVIAASLLDPKAAEEVLKNVEQSPVFTQSSVVDVIEENKTNEPEKEA